MSKEQTFTDDLTVLDEKEDLKEQEEQQIITLKPLILGTLDKLQVQWEYLTPAYARVGYLIDRIDNPFSKYVKNVLRHNQARIIQIGMNLPEGEIEQNVINIIQGFEVAPTMEGQSEFAKYRLNWVHLFWNVVCLLENETYLELIPRMQFKANAEGPLMGYIRPILALEDEPRKEILTGYLDKLTRIKWYVQYDEEKRVTDYIYKIEGTTINDRLLSLVIGGWSAMVLMVQKHEMEMVVQFLELCEDFYGNEDLSAAQKQIIERVVQLLSELTHPSLDLINAGAPLEKVKPFISQFIQTSRLFPLIHSNSRHVFYGVEKTCDFDLYNIIGRSQSLRENTALWRFKENNTEYAKILNLSIEK